MFAYVDDVHGIDIQLVKIKDGIFTRTEEIEVADSIDKHNDVLQIKPDKKMMGPLDASYNNKKTIRTRKSMFIPYKLAHLVIGKDLTPREAWQVLVPAIQAWNLETVCRPLIYFLLVTNTLPDGAQESLVQHSDLGTPGQVIMPAVTQHR